MGDRGDEGQGGLHEAEGGATAAGPTQWPLWVPLPHGYYFYCGIFTYNLTLKYICKLQVENKTMPMSFYL